MNDILNQFALPEGAMQAIKASGSPQAIADGVTDYIGGHAHNGVAVRFFIHEPINKQRSIENKYEVRQKIEMVQFYTDRYTKPAYKVTDTDSQYLQFQRDFDGRLVKDDSGDYICTGGSLKESYENWKKGLGAEGTPLSKWQECSSGEAQSFASVGIFSVEQLADTPTEKIKGRFTSDLVELWEKAKLHMNAKQRLKEVDVLEKRFRELEAKYDALATEKEYKEKERQMRAELAAEQAEAKKVSKPTAKKAAKAKKVEVVEEEEEEEIEEEIEI